MKKKKKLKKSKWTKQKDKSGPKFIVIYLNFFLSICWPISFFYGFVSNMCAIKSQYLDL